MLIDVALNPAEIALLPKRDLTNTTCVVFDVLRATSSMITALAHGAEEWVGDLRAGHRGDVQHLHRRRPEPLQAARQQLKRSVGEGYFGTDQPPATIHATANASSRRLKRCISGFPPIGR